jgi:hypothetical protein
MATIPFSTDTDRGEAKFFFTMACVMAASIVAGFAFNLAMGRSSFAVPWLVHFHAWVMMGWVGAVPDAELADLRDNVALHRRLGWLSVVWLPAILVMGVLITRCSLQNRAGRRSSTRTSSCSAIRCSCSASSARGRAVTVAQTPAGTAG